MLLDGCLILGTVADLVALGWDGLGRFSLPVGGNLAAGDEDAEAFAPAEEPFEKNPKMLCCFPVELVDFFGPPATLAGVRAAPVSWEPSAISSRQRHASYITNNCKR